jgi:hypothetical protein
VTATSVVTDREATGGRATATAPRLLVVSPVAPVPEGVGGVFLRDLCLLYPADRLAFAIMPGGGSGAWPEPLDRAPRLTLDAVPERGFNRWGRRVQRSTRRIFDAYVERRHLPRLIDQIARFAEQVQPDKLWIPLANPTLINAAARLAKRVGVPMVTTVWDAPDYFLPHYWGVQGPALARVMRRFGDAIRASTRTAVASTEMKVAYEQRYGTPCTPMIHGLPESQWIRPSGLRSPNDPFIIGYAGSLYAPTEWNALMSALGSVGWRLGGRDVGVRVLASALEVRATGPARIEFLGWQSTTDAVSILSECDVCYVPYWFDEACRPGVELSFPNKISLYLAAGRPIFFHGPRQSTPASFLARWPVGIACHSLDAGAIVETLRRAATDAAFHASAADAIPRVLREELGLHVFRKRFAEFLDVDDDVLAPAPA